MNKHHVSRFIRLTTVMEMTGMGKTYIYGCIAKGTFPKQIHIGKRSVVWNEKEIVDWMKAKINDED